MRFDEYIRYDGLGLAGLVRSGQVHATELLDIALARTDQTHAQLNAVVRRLDDRACKQAARTWQSDMPFAGVPFLVKDLFQDIAGVPTSWGSKVLGNVPAQETADVTRRWEEAGAVIFGMTNTPELGSKGVTESLALGPAHNPWDLSRTTGGSSGGSAAAVAAGLVPVAGANDGGGSIRIPAAACGLFGLKPGRGRVSMGPMAAEGLNGAAVNGVLSRSVRDTAAMLDVLQVPEPHGPYFMPRPPVPYLQQIATPPRRLRIGFSTASPVGTPVHADAVEAVQDAARLLASLGHHVEEAAPGVDGEQVAQDFATSWFCLSAALVDEICRQTGARLTDFEPDTRAMAAIGKSTSVMDLMRSQHNWHTHNRALAAFHARYDMWLSPVLSEVALPIGQLTTPRMLSLSMDVARVLGLSGLVRKTPAFNQRLIANLSWTPFTQLANLSGRPAMSVPLYWNSANLPLGVQFVAGLDGEGTLLQLAAELEAARPWFDRRPVI